MDDVQRLLACEEIRQLVPANWPERHTGRGTLPESWETWRRFWGDGRE